MDSASNKRPADGGGGGSRAAQRRARKKAKHAPLSDTRPDAAIASSPASAALHTARAPEPVAAAAAAASSTVAAASAEASGSAFPESVMAMPAAGSELFDALAIALANASQITGRKYRYGAILLAGEDHIPIKSGSNKTPFQRDPIHAEMSALKGCARPAGKDMLLARLAPAKPPRKKKGSGGSDDDDDDDDASDGDGDVYNGARGLLKHSCLKVGGGAGSSSSSAAGPREEEDPASRVAAGGVSALGKVLNARPCAKCEAKMVARGIRRCFFTLNSTNLGVLEYNAEADDEG